MITDPKTENRIRIRLIELLFRNASLSYTITLLNAVLVYLVLDSLFPSIELFIWLIAIIVVTLLRLILVSAYWNARQPYDRINLYKNLHLAGVYLTAVLWGSLIFIPEHSGEIWIDSFITVVISGITTGAVLALSSLLTAIIPFVVLILVPLAVFYFLSGDYAHFAMGTMVTFYLLLIIRLVFRNHDLHVETIRQQESSKIMFEFFEQAKKETDRQETLLENRITNLQGELKEKAAYFDSLDLPVVVTGLDGIIREVNTALLHSTGCDEENIIGTEIISLAAESDRMQMQSLLKELQANAVPGPVRFKMLCHDRQKALAEWKLIRHDDLLFWTGIPVST